MVNNWYKRTLKLVIYIQSRQLHNNTAVTAGFLQYQVEEMCYYRGDDVT